MSKRNHVLGVAFLAGLVVMPAMADDVVGVQVIGEGDSITFSDVVANSFDTTGGVILNSGTVTVNGTSQFSNNVGTMLGGVISNKATGILQIGNVEFNENTGYNGAVLYNLGSARFDGTALFAGNVAQNLGGAIYNEGSIVFDKLATFSGNKSLNGGNVIQNESTGVINFNAGLISSGNVSADDYVTTYGINNSGTMTVVGGDVVVNGNMAYAGAGFSNFGNLLLGAYFDDDDSVVSAPLDNITFQSNTATDGDGGAMYIAATDASDVVSTILNGKTTFSLNHAALNGGAISNDVGGGQSELVFNGNVAFMENSAGEIGGAIYNLGGDNGVITFNGDVVFSGNTDSTGANDIYNDGTINFNGNVTLDGGITGAGTIVLANGKFLNIGNASISQGAINMNGGTIVAMISNVDDEYRINVGDFSGDGTIALTLGDVGTYKIFGESSFSEHTIFEGNITFDSPIYHLEWIDNNSTITAARKTAEQIANDNEVSIDAARTILNLMDSSSDVLNDLGMSLQEQLAVKNRNAVEHAHHAIHPEMESVVQSVSTSVQTAIAKLAAGRMAIVQSSVGRSGGDVVARGGVWAEGMYNKSKQNDAFNGYTRGVTVGIDTKLGRSFMLGAGYSYARSDFSGAVRDTDVGSNTVFAYGQYKPTAWYMNAMLNYTMSDYVEKSDVLGILVESDYDVNAFGGAIMTGYDFAGGITPEMGVRYMHISADEYKNSLDIKSKLDDVDYLTGMLGAKYAFDYRVSRGFTLRPELRGAAKFDVISDENVATINMPGINAYVLDGKRLARMGAEFGVGIAMKYNDFSLALNYDIELREDYTSQTGRVRARYVF